MLNYYLFHIYTKLIYTSPLLLKFIPDYTTMIKILIADAHFLIRTGLTFLLSEQKDFELVGETDQPSNLIALAKATQPDVVIFDYKSGNHFSIDDIKRLKIVLPDCGILIISDDQHKESIFTAIEMGAISFLTKECDKEEIIGAVRATAKGEKFLCHKIIDIIIESHVHKDEDMCKALNLSARETEIIKLTAKGWQAKTIAEHLFLSTHTVYTHKKNIMKKLKINTSSEMIVYDIQNKLITEEEFSEA